jgi:hypothetical protein
MITAQISHRTTRVNKSSQSTQATAEAEKDLGKLL